MHIRIWLIVTRLHIRTVLRLVVDILVLGVTVIHGRVGLCAVLPLTHRSQTCVLSSSASALVPDKHHSLILPCYNK